MMVCLQLKEYIQGNQGIKGQCKEFNYIVDLSLKSGLGYTYCSIDMNECIAVTRILYFQKNLVITSVKKRIYMIRCIK